MPVPSELALHAAVDRVGTRLRLRRVLHATPAGLAIVGVGALAAAIAARLGWVPTRVAVGGILGALVLAIALVAWRARGVDRMLAARTADDALALADRLSAALAFLREPSPTPLMQLAIADGAAVAARVDARAVVPLVLPRSALVVLPLAALTLFAVRCPARDVVRAGLVPARPGPRYTVEQDALDAEREAIRRLAERSRGQDPALQQLAERLDELLAQVDAQRLSRNEVFAKLAELEANLARARKDMPGRPDAQLAALQKAFAQARPTKALAEALKRDDLDGAQKELERLAADAEKRAAEKDGDKDGEELARALDRAQKALDEAQRKADEERDRKIDQLKEEERRLKKEQAERPKDEETERKLQRNRRELERLEREREQQREQRRQLERLSRDLQKAAEQLRQKMSPEAMRRAAEQLGKMADEIRKLGANAQGQMQIAELKEVLRRAGRVDGAGEGDPKQGKGNEGGKGGDGERGERLAEFDKRAGGKTLLLGGEGEGDTMLMLPLPSGPGDQPGGPGDEPKGGDQHGDQHDPNLLGERTALDAQKKLIHARGQHGDGPSSATTILGASERGFSKRDYRRVYEDYSTAVEEVMSQEGVPPGYRYYVKRYFQLIRPRE